MSNVKNVILKKKVEGVIYDLLVKTNANQVVTDEGKTVATVLTELATAIATKASTKDIDDRINSIVDGAPETFDTLKEVADYITNHEDVYEALNEAIGNKVSKEDGKGLSTNDFTDELKAKLEELENITSISAENVTETENKNFVTSAEKAKIANVGRTIVSATEPEDLTENDMWFQEITNE